MIRPSISIPEFPIVMFGQDAIKHLHNMPAGAFAQEIATSGFALPRQVGKTTTIAQLAQPGDFVFHHRQAQADHAVKEFSFKPGTVHMSVKSDLASTRGRKDFKTEYITFWFDEPTAEEFRNMRSLLISDFIAPRGIDMTKVRFVFLTTMI